MTQPDELIDFIHLKSRRGLSQLELEDEVATDLQKATGLVDTSAANSANLNRVLQLTGQLLLLNTSVLALERASMRLFLKSLLQAGGVQGICLQSMYVVCLALNLESQKLPCRFLKRSSRLGST